MAVNKEVKRGNGRAPSGVATPPEGGWGWMIVAGCFLATICIRAVTRCVSVFFVEFQLHFERDYSTTAWIHSLIDSVTMLCAPLGGFLENRLSCRATVILGGMLSSFGLVLSSFASSLEHLYVSLGILTGLGFALSYAPSIAMVGRYFNERKALAYGIAQSGSGIGTFILAPVVQLLIENYSWRGALLVLGGFVSNLCVCGALMRPLQLRREEREKNEGKPEKDCVTKALDSKDAEWEFSDSEKLESKQLQTNNLTYTQGLLIANGALRNSELEDSKRVQGNITLLSDVKMSECILFSNNLNKFKMVESDNLNYKAAGIVDTKMEDSGAADTKASPPDVNKSLEDPSVETETPPGGRWCWPKSTEEFGFLLIPDFLMLAASFLFLAYGCSAPVVYLVPYALSLDVEYKHAAFLMSIFGISGIVGNITFGWITDRRCLKKYRLLSYMLAVSMEGLCCLFIPLLSSFPHLATFSVLYGYFDGAYVALIPVVTSDVVGPTYLSSALGFVYFLHAVPYLVSPPIGGWLVDRTGNYAATFLLSGASFMFCSVVLAAAMLVRRWRCFSAAGLCSSHPAAAQDVI